MQKKELIKYLLKSQNNFNGNIFIPMLDQYIKNIKDFYEYSNLTKLEDYLYYIKYKDIDYSAGKDYFEKYRDNYGNCSVCKKDKYCGRNYDWYYDNQTSFVIETEKTNSHFWSIGMSGGIAELDKTFVETKSWKEIYNVLPNRMLDGINENGVFCEVNVVPNGDMGKTTGTNPKGQSLSSKLIVRFVLDNAESARDAVEKLKEKNIWMPNSKDLSEEYHYMIADSQDTFVIEFINNEMIVLENQEIMTNFYLYNFDGTRESLTPFGAGLERYNILLNGIDQISSINDMKALMQNVNYSKAYQETTSPIWYSEFNGDYSKYGLGILTNQSPEEEFDFILPYIYQLWEDKTRDIPTVWHTVHTSIYDLENKQMTVLCQEGNTEYTFPLDTN